MWASLDGGVTPFLCLTGLTVSVLLLSDNTTPPFAFAFSARIFFFCDCVKSFPSPTDGKKRGRKGEEKGKKRGRKGEEKGSGFIFLSSAVARADGAYSPSPAQRLFASATSRSRTARPAPRSAAGRRAPRPSAAVRRRLASRV